MCSHIVAAIRKEASRVRDEWEALLCSKSQSLDELPKSSDAYCFEMLSMVLALSGSSVGRTYLAQQAGLLRDLFSLLHTGSARVQRQVWHDLKKYLRLFYYKISIFNLLLYNLAQNIFLLVVYILQFFLLNAR